MQAKKRFLLKETWGKKRSYYDMTTVSYTHIEKHYGYKLIQPYLSKSSVLIEFGCGNGSVIGNIVKRHKKLTAYGVDFSDLAIKQAKRLYKGKLHFFVGDAETVNLSVLADLTMSFFTFEHLDRPEKVFANMVRHTKKGGYIAVVCPNFGSPIYPSPCNTKSLFVRLADGLRRDVHLFFSNGEKRLLWDKVDPIIDEGMIHVSDHDTTIEPYIFAMKRFVEKKYPNVSIQVCSSGWGTVTSDKVSRKYWIGSLPFKFLSIVGLLPFKYWGPVHMLVVKKND